MNGLILAKGKYNYFYFIFQINNYAVNLYSNYGLR
jgi:hypothetical protein